jgi:hypothetical protein
MAIRVVAVAALLVPGVCEALTTTDGIPWDRMPGWIAFPVTMIGFLTFLVLFGFVGNAIAGLLILIGFWRGRHWPLWQAALASAPYWIVFYRTAPKPW